MESLDSKLVCEQFQSVKWNLQYNILDSLTWVPC